MAGNIVRIIHFMSTAKYHFHMPFTSELCTITSTLLLIQLMYLLERISISGMKSIYFLGKETLAIYLIHFMYLYLLPLGRIHTYMPRRYGTI